MNFRITLFSALTVLLFTFSSCTKKYADINISSASASIANGGNKDFGTVIKSSDEADNKIDFVIESSGTKEMNVSSIELSGTNATMFTLDKKNFSSGKIAKGSSQVFSISLKTSTVGDYNASVIINSDAKENATYSVDLTGTVQ
jgi:hypothetical protein